LHTSILCFLSNLTLPSAAMATVIDGVAVLIPPPEGYEVNFDNPQRNSHIAMYVVFGVGMVVAHAFLGQYMYVKLWLRRQFDLEIGMWLSVNITPGG
jgi:hypothetical protein